MIRKLFSKIKFPTKIWSGKKGKTIFLARTTPIIEGIPNIIPVLKSINLSLKLATQPNTAVKPTNSNEYVVAWMISIWNK